MNTEFRGRRVDAGEIKEKLSTRTRDKDLNLGNLSLVRAGPTRCRDVKAFSLSADTAK